MKKLIGKIISDKMIKSKVVEIVDVRHHKIYNKTYKKSKNIIVHDDKNEFRLGDVVEITSTKPQSRKKAWKILGKAK